MPKGIWRLTVRDDFAAGHALRNYKGKCENMHGHNFFVEVVVEGDKLTSDVEIVMDFGDMKKELKEVLGMLDHKVLNDTPPFDQMNPSSENLARFIYQHLSERVAAYDVRVYSVTVSEKAAQSATYLEL